MLFDFMEENADIAKGFCKGDKVEFENKWKHLTQSLNGPGPPTKSVTGWKKVTTQFRTAGLLRLNDDCLLYIFDQLDPRSQLKVMQVCQHFRNLIENHIKCKTLRPHYFLEWTMPEVLAYISLVGRTVLQVQWDMEYAILESANNIRTIAECIGKYCKHIEMISVQRCDSAILHQLLRISNHITAVHLPNPRITEDDILIIAKLPKLQSFSLCNNLNNGLKGTHLPVMTQLTELNLSSAFGVTEENFLAVCQAVRKTLKCLDVRETLFSASVLNAGINYCEHLEWLKVQNGWDVNVQVPKLKGLQTDDVEPLSRNFIPILAQCQAKYLEVLYIENIYAVRPSSAVAIAQMRKLKQLRFYPDPDFNDDNLYALKELQELEYLVVGFSDGITDAGVLRLISHCPRLELIDLWGCTSVTENLILNAVDWLLDRQRQQQNELRPFWMIVDPKYIKRTIIEHPAYKMANPASVLKLHFFGDPPNNAFKKVMAKFVFGCLNGIRHWHCQY